MTRHAALLLAVLVSAAPAVAREPDRAVITLERTTCFGTCPAYTVRITTDGDVDYEGKQFVRVTGGAHTTIAPADVASLVDAFEKAGYFTLEDNYRYVVAADGKRLFVSDLPTTITSIRIGRRWKKVVDYVGAPAQLKDLERRIDRVAGTLQWISVTRKVVLELQAEGWSANSEEGATYLRRAVQRNDLDTAGALLQAGADPNEGSVPPLFLARGRQLIALLVDWGGDVNHVTPGGETPLMWAARSGVAAPVRALLQAGALVNAARAGDGRTALQIAIGRAAEPLPPFPGFDPEPAEFTEVIALLRAAGAK